MRETLVRFLIKDPPKGDLKSHRAENRYTVSCVFVFYKRMDLMSNILHCLDSQDMNKEALEVILVEDQGGTKEGQSFIKRFPSLNISHYAPDEGWGHMGFMRNYGLSKAMGKLVLFLDDDTVITDQNFLSKIIRIFHGNENIHAVMSLGLASYALIQGRYDYHDPYFFTNRCMAYRRSCLVEMKGFDSSFIGQEDVEFAIRFIACGHLALKADNLCYYHPPLIFNDSGKGFAVGASFAMSKYSLGVKILLFFNGIRWLPLGVMKNQEYRNKSVFALGFAKGFLKGMLKKNKKVGYL